MTERHHINPLIKSTLFYIIATAIGQGMSFVSIIVFTRLMSKEDYGLYSTYFAAVSVLEVFTGANLFISLNNAYVDHHARFAEYQKTVLVLSGLVFAALFCFLSFLKAAFFAEVSWFVLCFALFHAYAFFLVNYAVYSANMKSDYRRKTLYLLIPNTLQFLFALVLVRVFSDSTFPARIIGSTAAVLLCAITVYYNVLRQPGHLIVINDWKYAFRIAVPSIAMSVSYMLMQQCDKMMITGICGAEETAVYSVIFYLGYALLAINQAIAPVRQAWVFKNIESIERMVFRNIQKWYLLGIAFLATGVLMIAPEVIKLLLRREYWRYEFIAPFVLSACLSISCGFSSELAMYYKKNGLLSISVVAAAALNVGLNVILLPRVGAVAAAYTTVAAYLLLHVLASLVIQKKNGKLYSKRLFLLFFLFVAAECGIFALLHSMILLRYVVYAVLLAAMVFYAIRRKEEWIRAIKKSEI